MRKVWAVSASTLIAGSGLVGCASRPFMNVGSPMEDIASERMIAPTQPDIIDVPGDFAKLISANYVLEHGKVPISSGLAAIAYPSYCVDFERDDAYNRTMREIEDSVFIFMRSLCQDLLEKDGWRYEDRLQWDVVMSEVTSDEFRGHPALNTYRSEYFKPQGYDYANYRSPLLNDLSYDIENGTCKNENDCDTKSSNMAIVMQRVENRFVQEGLLPAYNPIIHSNPDQPNFKYGGIYYIAYGQTLSIRNIEDGPEPEKGRSQSKNGDGFKAFVRAMAVGDKAFHSFIFMPSGTIFEASEHRTISNPINDKPFNDYIAGEPVLVTGSLYGGRMSRLKALASDEAQMDQIDGVFADRSLTNREADVRGVIEVANDLFKRMSDDPDFMAMVEMLRVARTEGLGLKEYKALLDVMSADKMQRYHGEFVNLYREVDGAFAEFRMVFDIYRNHPSFPEGHARSMALYQEMIAFRDGRPQFLDMIPTGGNLAIGRQIENTLRMEKEGGSGFPSRLGEQSYMGLLDLQIDDQIDGIRKKLDKEGELGSGLDEIQMSAQP